MQGDLDENLEKQLYLTEAERQQQQTVTTIEDICTVLHGIHALPRQKPAPSLQANLDNVGTHNILPTHTCTFLRLYSVS
jgi:hypothetical protein